MRYYEIIPIRKKTKEVRPRTIMSPKDVIEMVARRRGVNLYSLYDAMGYYDWFDIYQRNHSDVILARKLNDILKSIDANFRIGGEA